MRRFIFLALVFLASTSLITGLTACSSAPAPTPTPALSEAEGPTNTPKPPPETPVTPPCR
jgi:hypothetical protein